MVDISVIITSKNEAGRIEECLKSIVSQDYDASKIEIVLVDNNSTDSTKSIASRYTDKIYNFGPERSAQRNLGIKKSRGKYVLYLDADMRLGDGLLRECFKKCENNPRLALYVPEIVIGSGYWIRVRNFERSFYNATVIDAVRFFRKNLFDTIGGFDEALTGPEDWDFDKRVRASAETGLTLSVMYHDEGGFNFFKYFRKKAYYAGSFSAYIQKWGKDDEDVKKQLGLLYRYILVFLERKKFMRLFRHPVLAFGMYFLRFVVGLSYLYKTIFNRGLSNAE